MKRALTKRNSSLNDIESLIRNRVKENIVLEFKRELPGEGRDAKKEFAMDVSAFMNCIGGKILFGVSAIGGQATDLVGVPGKSIESDILRLSRCLENGLNPRGRFHFNWIPVDDDKGILELTVPPSSAAPHRVELDHHKFYIRDDVGKHRMDVDELRNSFQSFNAAKKHHLHESIKLSDAYRFGPNKLIDMVFEKCVLIGPANVAMLVGFDITGCLMQATEFVLVETGASMMNVTGFENCKFIDCEMNNLTWFITEDDYKKIQRTVESVPIITTLGA